MRKKYWRLTISLLFFIFVYHPLTAQNCYTNYKNQGDSYKTLAASQTDIKIRQANYLLAKQQYQIARNCSYLTNAQRIILDQLLAEVNNKLTPVRVITTIRRNFGS